MRPSLYPDILFHFTRKENLYSILSSNFRLSYARERLVGPDGIKEFAVPMVSYFDLKLSELKYFINQDYGDFGIGLTKEWANTNRLSPVLYINQYCQLMNDLMQGLEGIYNFIDGALDYQQMDDLSQSYHRLMNIYRFSKNYEADLHRRSGQVTPNYRFADEREWRYVPDLNTPGVKPFIPKQKIETDVEKQMYNQSISHIELKFTPNDIKYLIVDKEIEIDPLIDHLYKAKHKFDPVTVRRLASRILTTQQIIRDV